MDFKIIIWSSIFLALLAFKLWWDYRAKNKHKRVINHTKSALIDVLIYTTSSAILFGWEFWKWVLLACALRWILFDAVFNLLNGWKWNFCGNSSKIDYTIDKLDGVDDEVCKLGILLKSLLLIISLMLLMI